LEHVGCAVERGAREAQDVPQKWVWPGVAVAVDGVADDDEDEPPQAQAHPQEVPPRIPAFEEQTTEQHRHGDGETIQQHDGGDGRVLVRQDDQEVGVDVDQCGQHVSAAQEFRQPCAPVHRRHALLRNVGWRQRVGALFIVHDVVVAAVVVVVDTPCQHLEYAPFPPPTSDHR